MKVLYLTKYSRMGASSRLRSYQYFPFLNENGIEVTVSPLFNDDYLTALYQGKKSLKAVIIAYFKRFCILFTVYRYNKIVIEKELFPYFPPFFERFLAFMYIKYIVDYDDAIFHNYDLHPNPLIRLLLKRKIGAVMRHSETVIAGNRYLASKAIESRAKNVEIVPTVIDISRYGRKEIKDTSKTIIGWIGSPSTYKYVKTILPAIEKLSLKYPIAFHVVGANEEDNVLVKSIAWTEATEIQSVLNFDIGIMPLEDSPWEKGKCSYKLIQYMGCGLPVVASPVGMNNEVVEENKNGFLAQNEAEWISALEKLINDPELRKEFGENGRKKVEECYTLQQNSNKIIAILKK